MNNVQQKLRKLFFNFISHTIIVFNRNLKDNIMKEMKIYIFYNNSLNRNNFL